jgi:hypothetical protein
MEFQMIYRAAPGCREIQKRVTCRTDLLAILKAFATEPLYRETIVVSIHQITRYGAYLNGRRAKQLDVGKLTREAIEV